MTFKLRSYQTDIHKWMKDKDETLLYVGMSAGKTLTVLSKYLEVEGVKVVIYPHNVRASWLDDIKKFDLPVNYIDLNKSTVKNIETLRNLPEGFNGIIGASYKMSRLIYQAARKDRTRNTPHLASIGAVSVCLDECHRVGGYSSQQTLALTRMFKDVPNKIIMTGTAFSDSLLKLWSMVRFLFPDVGGRGHPRNKLKELGRTHAEYIEKFFGSYSMGHKRIPNKKPKAGAEERIAEIIAPFTYMLHTEDVVNLPEDITNVVEIPLSKDIDKLYRDLEKDYVAKHEDKDFVTMTANGLTSLIHLQQISTCGIARDLSNTLQKLNIKPRIDYFAEYVDILGDNTPAVIFYRYNGDLDRMAEYLNSIDKDYAELNGSRNTMQRFVDGETNIILCNIGSGSTGVRLAKCGSKDVVHILFWSMNWSNADYNQAKARVRRSDNESSSVITTVMLTSGIERRIFDAVTNKQVGKSSMDNSLQEAIDALGDR